MGTSTEVLIASRGKKCTCAVTQGCCAKLHHIPLVSAWQIGNDIWCYKACSFWWNSCLKRFSRMRSIWGESIRSCCALSPLCCVALGISFCLFHDISLVAALPSWLACLSGSSLLYLVCWVCSFPSILKLHLCQGAPWDWRRIRFPTSSGETGLSQIHLCLFKTPSSGVERNIQAMSVLWVI